MTYGFMGTLSESRLIPSVASIRQFRAEDLAEIVELYVCGLYILYHHKSSRSFAENYAAKAVQYGAQFDRWRGNANDLYAMLYALSTPDDVTFEDQKSSEHFKNLLPLGNRMLAQWLRELSHGSLHDQTHRTLFVRLDFNFKVQNSSIKAVRRLVMDWDTLNHHEQSLAMTRLLQMLRFRAPKSEILSELRGVASEKNLNLSDVCDQETGHGCDRDEHHEPEPEKKKGLPLFAKLAAFGAGYAAAGLMDKHRGHK